MTDARHEAVIGLEVHVQLRTRTKLFCACRAEFGAPPNTHVCPVCLGLPGALPVLNRHAVDLAVRTSVALGAKVNGTSGFDRKHYFYPDLPKGYQITQHARPLATGGHVDVPAPDGSARRISINRMHLEEDAGRSLHDRFPDSTAVDLNRAGVPLLEIVSAPELSSPAEARDFLVRLRQALEYLEVSDCSMEQGALRVDCNVSLRSAGAEPGGRTEIKNLDSLSGVQKALEFEIARQEEIVHRGERVEPATLLWDAGSGQARPVRLKEEAPDYRYMPEPDLPPLVVDDEWIRSIELGLPEMPAARARRFTREYALPPEHAAVLTSGRDIANYFEAVARSGVDPREAAAWVMGEVRAALKSSRGKVVELPVRPADLSVLLSLLANGTLSRPQAKQVFARMIQTGRPPAQIVADDGLLAVRDEDAIGAWVDAVLAEHPAEVERYRAGEEKLLSYLVGQVIDRSGGTADPVRVASLLRERLGR
jgi:aspartyl-tRNA(Asn)/glutamyl-tRNA(Gln) amidotransferase subunit B